MIEKQPLQAPYVETELGSQVIHLESTPMEGEAGCSLPAALVAHQQSSICRVRSGAGFPKKTTIVSCNSKVRQEPLNGLLVPGYVIAARFCAALPALQVISGIDGATPGTGVALPDFTEPLPVTDRPDPLQIIPQLDPMWPLRLKLLQFVAGVLCALTAEVEAPLRGAGRHFTAFAVGESLVRAAPITLGRFLGNPEARRKPLQSFRIFRSGDEQGACPAVKVLCLKRPLAIDHIKRPAVFPADPFETPALGKAIFQVKTDAPFVQRRNARQNGGQTFLFPF